MKKSLALLTAAALLAGCNLTATREEVEDAKVRARAAVSSADRLRGVLELIGLLPTYDCGAPRRTFVGEAVEGLGAKLACATIALEAEGAAADAIRVTFPAEGCEAIGHTLTGELTYRFSGGEDRFELAADLEGLRIDGEPVQAAGGYRTCSDETGYWARVEGSVPVASEASYAIDGRIALRDGVPVIGGTELVVDGPGAIVRAEGTDRILLEGLQYEIGEYLPKGGRLLIETASGRSVEVGFESTLWRLGRARIVVDGSDPVTVPIVH